jgi:hypothetical protein
MVRCGDLGDVRDLLTVVSEFVEVETDMAACR